MSFHAEDVPSWALIPQLVAGSGFTAACLISLLETQAYWFKPSYGVIGWHANGFNVVGGIFFLLTAVLPTVECEGYKKHSGGTFLFGESEALGLLNEWLTDNCTRISRVSDRQPVAVVRGAG